MPASRSFKTQLLCSLVAGVCLGTQLGGLAVAQTAPVRATPVSPISAVTPSTRQTAPALQMAQGRVEVLGADGTWAAQTAPTEITTRLRVGTGRAALQSGRLGQVVVGSGSELRRYLEEADLLSGKFFLRGPVAVHVGGQHVVMDGGGQLRADLSDNQKRVAVIAGQVRIALRGQTVDVTAGQQIALDTGRISAFTETDPWYASQFRGMGTATVEATRGPVNLVARGVSRVAVIGDDLQSGAAINTGANAWAEIGFTGGGYLRLNAQSELSVQSIERTAQGREVLLRLERGTAWNVVEKGQGGYRIDTPVVSTAVRGTVFRVDAAGLVKVFDGAVALPGSADQVVSQGQQRQPGGQTVALEPDELDRLNLAQDAARAQPLTLTLDLPNRSLQDLVLAARSLPDARVVLTVAGQTIPLTGNDGLFRLERLKDSLPEGEYKVELSAQRYGQVLTRTQTITVDRTPPVLSDLKVQRLGRVLTLSGAVTDAGDPRVGLSVTVGEKTYTRTVKTRGSGRFVWIVPLGGPAAAATLTLRDQADNRSHVQLP
ncbi:FecR family protein [Deinococcus arenicola]|uniref:FecR family protein n=1 Tax=Deinococcus arenicola TaxID=2994950 RepID=A0ABU4DSA5_9DEIO|nr:FecR family protein [Deinococcus sp. ZS9-10]MDV6375312.1 FecR family protein [Deinococcus sp. ZS9-10]